MMRSLVATANTFAFALMTSRRATASSLVIALAMILAAPGAPRAAETPPTAAVQHVSVTAGRSTILTTDFDVVRIAVTNPAVADATVVQPREVLIDGKSAGTVSLIVWGIDCRAQYDVIVDGGKAPLQLEFERLFPGEDIRVSLNDEALILSGHASNNSVMLKAGEIAEKTSSKLKVINLLQLPGGITSQQVMLQVRFAEVNRRALKELGASFAANGANNGQFFGRSTTQQFPAPQWDAEGKFVFSDFLNLFVFDTKHQVAALVRALENRGMIQSLAEPNLIAYNGQEASFLAGGEIPIPVVQGNLATAAVTILFKEFGVRLTFKPTIAGDVIRLHVKPEVSSVDFANGVTIGGFRIPALQTRRAETEVELRDGQSFAIAGLLDNISQDDTAAVPLLGSLPIIGNLFKSKAEHNEHSELMVLITPHLVRPLNPEEVPPLPTDPKRFIQPVRRDGGAALDNHSGVQDLSGIVDGGGIVDAPPMMPAAKLARPVPVQR